MYLCHKNFAEIKKIPAKITIHPIYDPLQPVKNNVKTDKSPKAKVINPHLLCLSLRKLAANPNNAGMPASNYPPNKFGL